MKSLTPLLLSLALAPALAQDEGAVSAVTDAVSAGDFTSAAKSAADALSSAAENRLLVRDLFGTEIKGSQGKTIGKVVDLVVVPGGQIVAALVETSDGKQIAIPYKAAKVARAAGRMSLTLPVSRSELEGMSELQSLAEQMDD